MTNSRHALAVLLAMTLLAGCSREKIDWKSAEAADTVEAYDHFLERHPDGELSTQARARVSQLNEERDWKRASATDTLQAYQQFLAQHENGKWTGEARIRVENFALDGTPTGPMRPAMDPEVTPAPSVAGSTASNAVGARYGALGLSCARICIVHRNYHSSVPRHTQQRNRPRAVWPRPPLARQWPLLVQPPAASKWPDRPLLSSVFS